MAISVISCRLMSPEESLSLIKDPTEASAPSPNWSLNIWNERLISSASMTLGPLPSSRLILLTSMPNPPSVWPIGSSLSGSEMRSMSLRIVSVPLSSNSSWFISAISLNIAPTPPAAAAAVRPSGIPPSSPP